MFKSRVREKIINISGYWIYSRRHLPVGCDFFVDLKYKIDFPLKTVFDVGANVGQTAIKFNRKFKDATIFSFEPINQTFDLLTENTRSYKRITCHNLALGDKKELMEVNLFKEESSALNSLKKEAMNSGDSLKETIKVTTGDDFCEKNDINDIDLLKIDTEGYEIEVLKGFTRMLRDSKIRAIYCEVGFSHLNKRNTYVNELFNFANQNNLQFFGLYEVYNKRVNEGKNFGNILFVNSGSLTS